MQTFIVLTRLLIGFAFVPSGLKKILGERFTMLGIDTPIGFFFEALYRSGIYYQFLGWAQLITAILLMSQRLATLGAIFFFFVIVNIWMITISLHFGGTWVITTMLLLADLMLICWDYNRLMPIISNNIDLSFSHDRNSEYDEVWVKLAPFLIILSILGSLCFEFGWMTRPLKIGWIGIILCLVGYGMIVDQRRARK
jgi:uncharacterized membrane protein YphA (DoxX/SURF4 family)